MEDIIHLLKMQRTRALGIALAKKQYKKFKELYGCSVNDYIKFIDEFKNEEYINMSFLNIKNLTNDVKKCTNLKHIILANNTLQTLPKELFELKNIYTLDLRYNKFTTIPKEIETLKTLKYLYLGGNQLKSLPIEMKNIECEIYIDKNCMNELFEFVKEFNSIVWL